MAKIPGLKKRPFWITESFNAIVFGVPTCVGAVIAAVAAWGNTAVAKWNAALLLGLAIWIALSVVVKFFQGCYKDRTAASKESPQDLAGCLWVIYFCVAARIKPDGGKLADDAFRMTIHRVDGEFLEQCVQYVGGSSNGEPGRKFNIRSGVIGRAAMTGQTLVAQRFEQNHDKFIDEMARDWHIPESEARQLRSDRQAWMAIPIKGQDNKVIAVVYADSDNVQFFSQDIQEEIVTGVQGISAFIDTRY